MGSMFMYRVKVYVWSQSLPTEQGSSVHMGQCLHLGLRFTYGSLF